MRQSLLGSLLEVVSTNLRHGRDDIAIFEIGKGYGAPADRPTHEWWRLGIALTGAALPAGWDRPPTPYDLHDAKGVLELVCRRLGFPAPAFTPITDDPNLHPGRAARVTAGGVLVGRVGELHPDTVAALDLRAERVYVAEVAIAGLAGGTPSDPRVTAPSRHLTVERDLAVIVARDRPAAEVEAAIRRHGGHPASRCSTSRAVRSRERGEPGTGSACATTKRTLTEGADAAVAAVSRPRDRVGRFRI
jgi:phenylalanyl-tRNA synthetase beta chain